MRRNARPKLSRHEPLHLTWRIAEDLPNLRRPELMAVLRHALALETPTQVRNMLRHVLNNSLHHWRAGGGSGVVPDPCSSGPSFDGWRDRSVHELPRAPVCAARCWSLRVGWRLRGLIGLREVPVGAA